MPMRPSPSTNFEDSTSVYKVPITPHEGDAARALIRAIEVHGEGVWFLHSTSMENPVLSIEVRDDLLVDLERPGHRSLLHRALLKETLLKKRDLERLEQRGLEENRCPGVLCLEAGIVDAVRAAESIAAEISSDLQEVLHLKEGYWQGPVLQPIDSGMRGRVEVGLSCQQALLRSARQHGSWNLIGELPLLREVMAAGPSAFALVQHAETSAEVRSLLEAADGQKDLFELTRHRPDPWRALDRALELMEMGHLQTLSAIQLFQLGEGKLEAGNAEEALRHWRRAEEKGLDDFDLCGRIGEICARSDRRQEALFRLRQHARKSTEQLRFEAARQAWTELVCLDPTDDEAIDRAVQFWIKEPGKDLAVCLKLASSLKGSGRWGEIAELVSGVGVRQPDVRLHEWHAEAARALGDEEMELKAIWRQAECLRTGSDPFAAIPCYKDLLGRGHELGKVSLRLAEMQLQQGEVSAARNTLKPVFQGKLKAALYDCEESLAILQSCSRHDSVPFEILDFLFEVETDRGNAEASRRYLVQMLESASVENDDLLVSFRVKSWFTENKSDYSLLEQWISRIAGNSRDSEVLAAFEFALRQLELTSEQRLDIARKGLDTDPSHPVFLKTLISSEHFPEEEKAEWYRRISLRGVADGEMLPVSGVESFTTEFGWRNPLLNLVCQQKPLSGKTLNSVSESVLTDGDYLRKLLLEHAEMDSDLRQQLSSMKPAAASPAPSTRATVVRSSIGGITEKLKNIHGEPQVSGTPAVESEDSSCVDSSREETVSVASDQGGGSSGIQSALDRLKAMRNPVSTKCGAGETEKSDKDRQEIPTSLEERKPPSGNAQPKVNAAIARLGALRNGGNLATGVDEERHDP